MSTNADWTRTSALLVGILANKSPLPINVSAPTSSKMVLESKEEETDNATRAGIFALMSPVMTLTDGRCVAMMI